ncbi:MAG: hypothetical protein Unbinned5081contig1000_33 [Prokaryotic dsDNA virus sp.]|nr:MAG: hypothetical protein Unbinned5081contig1000_33 [Prokaryotic dsDNA virus sp.]
MRVEGDGFYIHSSDAITNLTAAAVVLRFDVMHKGRYPKGNVSLKELATDVSTNYRRVAAQGMTLRFEGENATEGRIGSNNVELTSNKDIKNLMQLACEDVGVSQKRFRSNWTLIRKHMKALIEMETPF